MTTPIHKSLIDEQIEDIEFAGKTKASAVRLAKRCGFTGQPARYSWVAPGIWLLRYTAPEAGERGSR
ncbi:hypothetical protein [Pseudomonas typographi]|uniref:Transposase n=1 Tax=Pseudomonas typographi TaxID=2715964 RepID=A0ABR7Z9Q4_9PSED|nr:hypothetical protein [Pseudomonas typographi]MBD1602275.1 hypothetical protein [Pseudomonas typographi]